MYNAKAYHKHKKYYIAKALERKKKIKDWVVEYKKGLSCVDCGYNKHSAALDFDHLKDKLFNISEAYTRTTSIKKIEAEIAKCEVVCANCHRIRTFQRSQSIA